MTGLILIALVLLAAGGSSKAADAPSSGVPSQGGDKVERKKLLYAKLQQLPLAESQRLFVMLVAYGETGGTWKATAHNNTASEVAASRKAWDNNATLAAKLTALGHGGKDAWAIGSGGYGGRLVPYFGDDMLDAGLASLATPQGVFDPDLSIVSTILTCWKLQQTGGWAVNPTVGNLRVGFYGPGYMGTHPPADRIAKYKRHASEVGLDAGAPNFVMSTLPMFPGPGSAAQLLGILRSSPAVS